MLIRTHFMFAVFMILIFFNYVNNKLIFVVMVLIATIIPDLDNPHSKYGSNIAFSPLQSVTKHRGFIHSFTTAVILVGIIAIWWPVASFGFFIGYSVHLITDSFTKNGIRPFWPFKWEANGPITTVGKIEDVLFLGLIVINVLLFFILFIFGIWR